MARAMKNWCRGAAVLVLASFGLLCPLAALGQAPARAPDTAAPRPAGAFSSALVTNWFSLALQLIEKRPGDEAAALVALRHRSHAHVARAGLVKLPAHAGERFGL